MALYLFVISIIIILCVLFHKLSNKIGVPMLLAFILLGMIFGSDGAIKIAFDNFKIAEQICSIALLFIMFYGGFGTNWKQAKSVSFKAFVLSSLGTLITAGLVGIFCYFALHIEILESFLIGAVLSSTDAASVFSILRSKRLSLRYNTASLLEIESGSNDPFAYMLTMIILSLMSGDMTTGAFLYMVFAQLFFGILFGFGIAFLGLYSFKKINITSSGFHAIFMVAIAIISYALPTLVGGNGFLSAYITGVILGNQKLQNKLELVHFFDGITGLMQMLLFFLLGLLAFPSQLSTIALTAIWIALFLTCIARPMMVFLLLKPFESNLKQKLLVSWSGMRGAASIVFSIMVVIHPANTNNDVFHIVFFIVLFSILLQGTLLPFVSKKLDMIDMDDDVMKTFSDYIEETPVQCFRFEISNNHPWIGKEIQELVLPPKSLVILILRNSIKMVPSGTTTLCEQDVLIVSGESVEEIDHISIYEKKLTKEDPWIHQCISSLDLKTEFLLLIKRGDKAIVPNGDTILLEHDICIITERE